MPFVYDVQAQVTLENTITVERLAAYLARAKGQRFAAIQLYENNTRMSESLFGVIQCLEVEFRNSCHLMLSQGFGTANWYNVVNWDLNELRAVNEAKKKLQKWGKTPTPGRLIAELTFGFWVRLVSPQYEKRLWVPYLYKAVPHMRPPSRTMAFNRLEDIRKLRNRIAHHEPIFHRNLRRDYEDISDTVGWICPVTTAWLHATNSFVKDHYGK